MADASKIKHAEELLQFHLLEWRDAGGHTESVTGAILRLIVARERFAEAVRAEKETFSEPVEGVVAGSNLERQIQLARASRRGFTPWALTCRS